MFKPCQLQFVLCYSITGRVATKSDNHVYGSFSHSPSLNLISEEDPILDYPQHHTDLQGHEQTYQYLDTYKPHDDADSQHGNTKSQRVNANSQRANANGHHDNAIQESTSMIVDHPWTYAEDENPHDPENNRNDNELSAGAVSDIFAGTRGNDQNDAFASQMQNSVEDAHMPKFKTFFSNSENNNIGHRNRHSPEELTDTFPFPSTLPDSFVEHDTSKQNNHPLQNEVGIN